jgi:hypothetical protein
MRKCVSGSDQAKAWNLKMKEAREKYNVSYLNYILPKRNEIQLEGRFHTEDEISKIDLFIPIYLNIEFKSHAMRKIES